METKQLLEKEYYSFIWHFDNTGIYFKNLNIQAKASNKTITLENKLDPSHGGFKITVPAELYVLEGEEWKRHPVVFLRNNNGAHRQDIIVILENGKHTFTNYTSRQEEFYKEAEEKKLAWEL